MAHIVRSTMSFANPLSESKVNCIDETILIDTQYDNSDEGEKNVHDLNRELTCC